MVQKISIFITVWFLFINASAAVFEIQKDTSEVEFLAVGKPSMLKIKGKGAKPEGKITIDGKGVSAGEVKIDLNEFDTGMSLRNQHMKEKYLHTGEADKRYSTFKINKIGITNEMITKGGKFEDVPIEGTLNLHGVDKPFVSKATVEIGGKSFVEIGGKSFDVLTKLKLKLSDFKIDIPSYLGVTVAEDVDVDVKLKGIVLNEAT